MPFFSLTPNPANDYVDIHVNPAVVQPCHIILRGATGRTLLSFPLTSPTEAGARSFSIKLHDYPTGIYLLTLRTPLTAATQRLTVID